MWPYYETIQKKAHDGIFHHYASLGIHPDPVTKQLDITATYDGSWRKRGHTSHFYTALVFDDETGIIIDYEVICSFCFVCSTKKKISQEEWNIWYKSHKPKCHKNLDGTPAAMEAAAVVKLWTRSTNHNFCCVSIVSDGDSSAYKAVCKLNHGCGPYETPVQEEQYVNHVAKRLGTHLRKLKQDDFTVIMTRTGKKMKCRVLGGAKS
ncbi:hypothetical protein E2C01_095716 [Portunus trituberculatus]|uniref:Mutator-like transposase domain-containing protein n=1 Tax=Portunus trituberculatus TaxID=210409 RepID=A0A5B7K042_PORTR|nr:hypothetical protein [Portunus trituberculatus]